MVKQKRGERETGSEWLTGAHKRSIGNIVTLPFNCNNATQDKIKGRKKLIEKSKDAWVCKCVLMMGKARRRTGA